MRKIKFRGVRVDGNGYAYGDLTHDISGRDSYVDGWLVKDVTQFAGYDSTGKEIYVGDTVIFEGKDYKVSYCFCYGAFKNLKRCRKK